MAKHLAVVNREAVVDIFSGKKKIEGRFSQIRIAPFGKVSAGDIVLIKIGGKEIVGQFIVDRVIYFDHPTNEEVIEIKKKYGRGLSLPATFWLEREKINYATLMFIKSVTKFIVAPDFPKKDLRGWVVI
ncbi:hypothetical protein A2696_01690 [Candidatus Curtissbacteria bacterium RIFCSPHIGHO2_01_FULL_41_13]|uniref:ASCH domain-containing protein n=1 Tax=Candidatus Curtissbacteria bacterium RIFCSPHIGHO2_01_FULL_41_13 TaxID=1797745 RepID=A0A1F5G009_9BACT|nr:MAG: hypothetical protein A2696_01690 [Candidatus Curtissbacteria bacterium RIFCSPHIGHO2_01_FULL_41_13]